MLTVPHIHQTWLSLSRGWKGGGYLENGNSIVWVNTPSARVRWWFDLGTHCWWSRMGVSTMAAMKCGTESDAYLKLPIVCYPQHLSNTLLNCPIIRCLRWLWLSSEASTLAISIWWWECDLSHLCLCHLKSTSVSSLCLVFSDSVFSSCVYPQWLFP